jgi:acylphosphatase
MCKTVITKRLVIHGRVQGVYFRDSMRQLAQQLGVTGWVRNRRDGTVEAMAQGAPIVVDKMIEWAREGPEFAQVTDVQIEDAENSPFDNFAIFRSA